MQIVNIHTKANAVYLFLRDNAGKLSCKVDKSFLPYWFEPSLKGEFKGFDGTPLEKKIILDPKDIKVQCSEDSFESDVKFYARYAIDKIRTFDQCPIKWSMIDIEVLTPIFPDQKKAKYPVSCISIYNSFTNKIKTFFIGTYDKRLVGKKYEELIKNYPQELADAEIKLFKDFIKYMRHEKFDIWFSWNVNFDYGYCFNRFAKLPQKEFFDKDSDWNNFAVAISPIKMVRSAGGYTGLRDIWYPAGISIVDYLTLFKKIYKYEKDYTLNGIMKKYLKKGKEFEEVNFDVISDDLKMRNIGDVRGMVFLEQKKFKLVPHYDELRRFGKIRWEDLDFPLRLIDSLYLQTAKELKIILPKRRQNIDIKEEFKEIYDVDKDKPEGAYREAYKLGLFFELGKYDLGGAYMYTIIDSCLDSTNIKEEAGGNTIPVKVTDRVSGDIIKTHYIEQNENTILPYATKLLLKQKQSYKELRKNTSPDSPEFKDVSRKYNAIKDAVLAGWGVIANKTFRLFDLRIASMITSTVRDLLHYTNNRLKDMGYEVVYVDTDSVFVVDKGKDISELLTGLIKDWSKKRFNKESSIEYEHEGHFKNILITGKCRYKGYLKTGKGLEEEMKGIEAKRKDSTVFMAKFQDELFERILKKVGRKENIKWIKEKIKEIKDCPIENISFPCRLGKEVYDKSKPIFVRALQATQELNPKFEKRLGENFYYIYVTPIEIGEEEVPTYTFKGSNMAVKTAEKFLEIANNNPESDNKISYRRKEYTPAEFISQVKMDTKTVKLTTNVLAFDKKCKDHVTDIDWKLMLQRNILNKVQVIFNAMDWKMDELLLEV